jgi:hypothetical protein
MLYRPVHCMFVFGEFLTFCFFFLLLSLITYIIKFIAFQWHCWFDIK